METREPKLGVAVGKKGVGKSYQTELLINTYIRGNPANGVLPRRALILDVNDEFVNYKAIALKDIIKFSVHPTIECRRIRPFKDNGQRMTLSEIATTLFKVLNDYSGGLLLIEDPNKFLSDNLPNDVVGAICTNRHTDTDIIMHFQSIGRITTKVWQNINWLRFHKNTDSVDRHKEKFMDKYEYLKIAEILVDQKYYLDGDKRYFIYVDIDEERLMGDLNQEDVDRAIDEYISKYYKNVIQPLVNQTDIDNGGKKHTVESAVELVKSRIMQNHILKKG